MGRRYVFCLNCYGSALVRYLLRAVVGGGFEFVATDIARPNISNASFADALSPCCRDDVRAAVWAQMQWLSGWAIDTQHSHYGAFTQRE
jgi:hypothetical protein